MLVAERGRARAFWNGLDALQILNLKESCDLGSLWTSKLAVLRDFLSLVRKMTVSSLVLYRYIQQDS